jgi:glutamyl-tRNA(Gln) amidotransferase subunit E
MKGLFGLEVQPDKDFGLEIFEKSMLVTSIPCENHFHSDENEESAVRKRSNHPCRLPIDEKKIVEIRSIMNPEPGDAFIVVVGPERRAMHAMKKIVERAKMALDGVPQETRRLLPSGNSEFLRVIHGKERIYPDTDTPPIVISKELVEECRSKTGKRPWEIYEDLHGKNNFTQNQVDLLIRDEKVEKFCSYVQNLGLQGALAYHLLIELPRYARRKGLRIDEHTVDKLAEGFSKKLISRQQVEALIQILAEEPELSIKQAVKELAISRVTHAELDSIIQERLSLFEVSKIVSDPVYRKRVVPKIVGEVLKSVNYSVEGKIIAKRVQALAGRRKIGNAKER